MKLYFGETRLYVQGLIHGTDWTSKT